jgi:hypothetical protein
MRDLRGLKNQHSLDIQCRLLPRSNTWVVICSVYSGQGIDLEGTFENVMNKAYSNSGLVRAYLVKPGV